MTAELSSINPNTSLRGVVVSLPVKPIKANVDLLGLMGRYGDLREGEGKLELRDRYQQEYGDYKSDEIWPQIADEVERLQGNEYDLGEILEATTGVLLVLSRLWLDGKLTADDMALVLQFRQAIKEAKS